MKAFVHMLVVKTLIFAYRKPVLFAAIFGYKTVCHWPLSNSSEIAFRREPTEPVKFSEILAYKMKVMTSALIGKASNLK